MKTITLTNDEAKVILNALTSRKIEATNKAKQQGLCVQRQEQFLNVAIDTLALHVKIENQL